MAIYNSLGWTKIKIYFYYVTQIIILLGSGFVVMILFSIMTYPFLTDLLFTLAGLRINLSSFQNASILLLVLALLTMIIVALPFFDKINSLSTQQVFQDSSVQIQNQNLWS
jgi:hypothetical protein